jgi:hypothetical protein
VICWMEVARSDPAVFRERESADCLLLMRAGERELYLRDESSLANGRTRAMQGAETP